MMKVKILLFEDSAAKTESFRDLLALRLQHELGYELEVVRRDDESMLETDLMTTNFHFILIDDDLGNRWGNEIIDRIMIFTDENPDSAGIPKLYYSAGTPVEELGAKIGHHGNIPCVTFWDLVDEVFQRIRVRYSDPQ